MRRTGIFLLTLVLCTGITTGISFAQGKPEFVVGQASVQTVSPTPTPKSAQPTTNPSPTAQIPSPTTVVTVSPAQQTQVTPAPKEFVQTQEPGPTATPTPLPPTPPPKKLKPVVLPIVPKKPPEPPIAQMITAPFDLVVNSLPYDYYNQQGLAPVTNRVLLAFAFFSLLAGTFLLNLPAIRRTVKNIFAPKVKERKSLPYVTGSLTK